MDDIRLAVADGNLASVMNYLDAAPDIAKRGRRAAQVLAWAMMKNQQAIIQAMLAEEFDVNQRTPNDTLLQVAARCGQTGVFQELLARGADVNAADHLGKTALAKAAGEGDLRTVALFLEHRADTGPQMRTHGNSASAINHALNNGKGHFAVAKALLEHGANANETIYGKPLLSVFIEAGQIEIVRIAIERGVDVNAQEERLGKTVLQCAAECGHADIVEMLLKAGARADRRDKFGYSPLLEAVGRGHTDVVRVLLEHGSNDKDKETLRERKTALTEAVERGYIEITRILLNHGGNPNSRHHGSPLLIVAVENSYYHREPIGLVRVLLECGARVNARDKSGWTAWMWANAQRNQSLMELLEEWKAKTDLREPVPLVAQTLAIIRDAERVETFRVAACLDENGSRPVEENGWGFPMTITVVGPVLGKDFVAKIGVLLKDYRTYMGGRMKCGFSPGIGFRLYTNLGSVAVLICFNCHEMLISTFIDGLQSSQFMVPFGFVYQDFAELAQTAFPNDPHITALGLV